MGRLDGKVAVITGATSGIGLRTAEIFVAEGAKIVIAGRRVPEGEALAKKLGANCIFRQTDVMVDEQMRALIELSVEKFGRIDCLFNNAGGPAQTGGIEGLDAARFDAAMVTLVRSVMLGMKYAAPHMRKQGSGSIINNGSIAGRLAGYSTSLVYGAAKAAVIHLTKCVAMELGEVGIRVNSISPGVIATGIFGKALGLSVEAAEKTPELMHGVYKSAQPIPRAGLPEDIAHAAVFLASDESSFINGHDLVIDGAITGGKNWTVQQQGYVGLREAFEKARGRRPAVIPGRMRSMRTRNPSRFPGLVLRAAPGMTGEPTGRATMSATFSTSLGRTPDGRPLHLAVIAGLACAFVIGKALPSTMDAISTVIAPLCASSDPAGSSLDAVEPIGSYALPNVPGKRVTIVRVFYGPGGFTRPHRHAGSVTAYITKGEIRSQLGGGPVETFKVGQSFFEPPGATHLVSANASNTEPAELIAVFVADEGAQLTTFIE